MTDNLHIKIYTRSMSDILYHMSMALCRLPYNKYRLKGTSADGYLYQIINDKEADWVINIDEDAFVCDIAALERLIIYCIENEYDNCGMPDGGVVHLRDGNPLVTNPYFNILNTKNIRKQFSVDSFVEAPSLIRFERKELLVGSHDFTVTNVEPYYPFFIWMSNHYKILYLKATNHPDGESTILCNHLGEPFLIHTWYSRLYNRDKFHTRRIDRAFQEACTKQEVVYNAPLCDTIECAYYRLKNYTIKHLVNIRHLIIKK